MCRQPVDNVECRIPLTALQLAQVGAINAGIGRKTLLRLPPVRAEPSQIPSQEFTGTHGPNRAASVNLNHGI